MSRERGVKAIRLEPTDIVPRTEVPAYSAEVVRGLTGIDPTQDSPAAWSRLRELMEIDLVWGPGYGAPTLAQMQGEEPEPLTAGPWGISDTSWAGQGANLGRGRIKTIEDVLAFEPEKIEPRSEEELADEFQARYDEAREKAGDQYLVLPSFYWTCFHWGLAYFGWELYAVASKLHPAEMKSMMERFAQVSAKIFRAWAQVEGLVGFISHDDICATRGPAFHPDWLREHVFSRYPEIWRPLKEKGIKIVYCTDGDCTAVLDDLVAAGADGFWAERYVSIADFMAKYGGQKIFVGNVDERVLTFGTPEDVYQEVKRCIEQAGGYPGYVLAACQLPGNIPLENARAYEEAVSELRKQGPCTQTNSSACS